MEFEKWIKQGERDEYVFNTILNLLREQKFSIYETRKMFKAIMHTVKDKNPIVEWEEDDVNGV